MSRVSVVIPCYNSGAHLLESLDCALGQTHPDLEVVVVDDGSTEPATLARLQEVSDRGVLVVRQDNAGLAAARNAGIRACSGAYVLPLDADDVIDPTYAEKAAAVLDDRPEVGIVYCLADYFGDQTGPWVLADFTIGRMLNQNVIFATAMFRRSDWATVAGYPETVRVHEDHGFWLRILGLERSVVRIEETLFRYRRHEGQMTGAMAPDVVAQAAAVNFRDNVDLYLRHADEFSRFRTDQWAQLVHWKSRYGRVERVLARLGGLRRRRSRKS